VEGNSCCIVSNRRTKVKKPRGTQGAINRSATRGRTLDCHAPARDDMAGRPDRANTPRPPGALVTPTAPGPRRLSLETGLHAIMFVAAIPGGREPWRHYHDDSCRATRTPAPTAAPPNVLGPWASRPPLLHAHAIPAAEPNTPLSGCSGVRSRNRSPNSQAIPWRVPTRLAGGGGRSPHPTGSARAHLLERSA
jgi:hypothetical protein